MVQKELTELRMIQWELAKHPIPGFQQVAEKIKKILDRIESKKIPDRKCPECGNVTTLSRTFACGWYEDYEVET